MQPIKLTIQGDFWDSQIYKNRLYMWDMDNSLRVYDWEGLIEGLAQDDLRLPLVCAFSRGDLLYRFSDLSVIFEDPEVRMLLKGRFDLASRQDWNLSLHYLEQFVIGTEDSPFGVLHDDSAIYNDDIYALTDLGLYAANIKGHTRRNYSSAEKARKLWDGLGNSMQVGVGNATLAIAAGDDGLFDFPLWSYDEPKPVSKHHTLFANWAFASIYGSSDMAPGYLAEFYVRRRDDRGSAPPGYPKQIREFAGIVDEEEIFESARRANAERELLSWGSQEKLYLVTPRWVDVVQFDQKNVSESRRGRSPFQSLGKVELPEVTPGGTGHPIAGGVAHFGLIIEYEHSLLVVMNDGESYAIPGPITQWRVFPRSVRYRNHLHVILEDCIEIYSFNNDYVADQGRKMMGIQYRKTRGWRG